MCESLSHRLESHETDKMFRMWWLVSYGAGPDNSLLHRHNYFPSLFLFVQQTESFFTTSTYSFEKKLQNSFCCRRSGLFSASSQEKQRIGIKERKMTRRRERKWGLWNKEKKQGQHWRSDCSHQRKKEQTEERREKAASSTDHHHQHGMEGWIRLSIHSTDDEKQQQATSKKVEMQEAKKRSYRRKSRGRRPGKLF